MADSSPLAHSPTLAVTEPRAHGDSEARLAAGTAVGEYVVDKFIGAGAMGEVYGGRHPIIGKRVAIKVLRHELAASAEAAERFIREARAANQIDHENVVDVFAFGRLDDGRLYLVMDLVEGRSLRAHLVDGPLELQSALDILETIAGALDAAHARGVVHRDLKPDNIVLSSATPPKVFVLDFGIAKLIATVNETGAGTAKGTTLTGAGTWLGTPGYMAPEQWSVDGAGPASDRYALAVIAFELLTGAQPFSASSVPGMMEQHFRAEVPTLNSRGGVGLPSALDSVLRKGLAKDPDARYASAKDLVAALRDAAGTGAMRARGAITPPGAPHKLWIPAIAGVAVLGVGIVAVVVLGRDRDKPPETIASRPQGRNAPPAGSVTIDVISKPIGAEVSRDGTVKDVTPTQLFAKPGESLVVRIRKPGYLPEKRAVQVGPSGSVVEVKLVEVSEFRGVWQLPNGELRAFERRGDNVDVFKLTTVTGERTFFTRYSFTLVDSGIGFGGEDLIADPHAPNEPTCNVHMRVDYVFDPNQPSALEQRREHVELDFANGKCTERVRRIMPAQLVRADRQPTETHELAMPVGKPVVKGKNKQAEKVPSAKENVLPLDPKAELAKKKQQELEAKKKKKGGKSPPNTDDDVFQSTKNVKGGADKNLTPPNAQIVPEPQASAPPPNQVGPPQVEQQQQANPPPQQAPPQQKVVKPPTKNAAPAQVKN